MTRARRSRAVSAIFSLIRRSCSSGRSSTPPMRSPNGAPDVLASIRHSFPWLRHVFADGGYSLTCAGLLYDNGKS